MFSECKKATTWDSDEYELLRKICRILVALGGYRLAWVGYAAHDEEKSVKPVAHWGYEEGYLNSLKVSWDESVYGQGPAGTTIRTGQTVIVQDIMSNPKFRPWREMALAHGFTSAISLPLHNGSKVYGALVILAAEVGSFDAEEASQLEELTDDLANRIRVIHSEAAQKKVKEEQLLLAKVIHQASEGVMTFDQDARVQYLNPAWEAICGVTAKDVVSHTLHEASCSRHNEDFYLAIRQVIATGEASTGQYLNQREDGSRYRIEANISPVHGRVFGRCPLRGRDPRCDLRKRTRGPAAHGAEDGGDRHPRRRHRPRFQQHPGGDSQQHGAGPRRPASRTTPCASTSKWSTRPAAAAKAWSSRF